MYNLNLGNIIINLIRSTILNTFLYTYLCARVYGYSLSTMNNYVCSHSINLFFHNYIIYRKSDCDT